MSAKFWTASYEDYARCVAAAKEEGADVTAESFSIMDHVEPSDYRTRKRFGSFDEAVNWLKGEVKEKSVFAVGGVDEFEIVPRSDQCRYCVCRGFRPVNSWHVTADGVEEECGVNDGCVT